MPTTSYDAAFYQPLLQAEEKHFWFRIRNQIIAYFVAELEKKLPADYRALEIGSGNGNTLRVLQETSKASLLIGSDLFHEGLQIARHRLTTPKSPLVQADVAHLPFEANFDVVFLFDVLEHIEDQTAILRNIHQILKPQGYLFLTVPADPDLWSYFDEASRHVRRYTYKSLKLTLEANGFNPIDMSAFMNRTHWLLKLRRKFGQAEQSDKTAADLALEELSIPAWQNAVLYRYLSGEVKRLKEGARYQLGSSLLAIAQKRD